MAKIIDIEGIGPKYAKQLAEAGISTTGGLLKSASSRRGRDELAKQAGVQAKQVLEWVNRADLFRVKGVGSQYSDLLEAAGVDTVAELAKRRADSLMAKLAEANSRGPRRFVRQLPTQAQVAGWIDNAKTLPKMITH